MDASKLAYLDAIGIDVWVARAAGDQPYDKAVNKSDIEILKEISVVPVESEITSITNFDQAYASNNYTNTCTNCEAQKDHTTAVFGVGNTAADWLIITDGSNSEDQDADIFAGKAGKLFNAMLQAVGLKRERVYIADIRNILTTNNEKPDQENISCCHVCLKRQIGFIQPKVILSIGEISTKSLLGDDATMDNKRGKQQSYAPLALPVIVTSDPARLLDSPSQKSKSWADLLLARSIAGGSIVES